MKKLKLPKISVGLLVLGALTGITAPANAFTLTTFSDREAWESAVSGNFSEEDFNTTTEDMSFNGVNLKIGELTLNGIGNRQKIDSPDDEGFDVPTFSVDGTPMILGQTDDISSFVIRFDFPITAFGGDFDDITSQGVTQLNADANVVGTIPINTQFFGFVADESFISLSFTPTDDQFDGFGLDNLVYVPSGEPPLSSSPTHNRTINSDVVNLFFPVEFSPSQNVVITFDDIQNVPFTFSPTLGLISIGGIWVVTYLFKKFGRG